MHRRPARHPSLQKLTPCHSPTIKICSKERKHEHQMVETSLETHALSGTSIKSMARADKFKQISAIKIIRPQNGTRRVNTTIIIVPSIARQPRSLPTSSYRWLPAKAKRKTSTWSSYSCSSTRSSRSKSPKKTPRICTCNRFPCKQRQAKSRKMHKNLPSRRTAWSPYSPRAQCHLSHRLKGWLKSRRQI